MLSEWNNLSDSLQIALSQEALRRAAAIFAAQAETLADEMDEGTLADRGGAEALRLFAAVLLACNDDALAPHGFAETASAWPAETPTNPHRLAQAISAVNSITMATTPNA